MPVQQQKTKTDSSIVGFDESKLREHLYFCFQNSNLALFPLSSIKERKNKVKTIFLNSHCNCRMRWSNFDEWNFDMQMIKCDACLEWFHRKCEHIPDIVFSPNLNWGCHKCKEISWIIMRLDLLEKFQKFKNSDFSRRISVSIKSNF